MTSRSVPTSLKLDSADNRRGNRYRLGIVKALLNMEELLPVHFEFIQNLKHAGKGLDSKGWGNFFRRRSESGLKGVDFNLLEFDDLGLSLDREFFGLGCFHSRVD